MKSNLIYEYVQNKMIFDGSKISLPPNIKLEIEQNWKKRVESGKKFENNELFTVTSIEVNQPNIIFNVKKQLMIITSIV